MKDNFFSTMELLLSKGKGMKIPIILGLDSDDNVIIGDLVKLESILMGGQTGSGKSIFINSVICSLLLRFSLDECKFVLIDPKRVEYSQYGEGLSPFYNPVISNPNEALCKLETLVRETDWRLEQNRAKPYLIVVIDTFVDLFVVEPEAFQERICYIASHSKETNIFIIISDSRVGPEIYTDKILNTFRAKIAFATADEEGSRCLLGIPDAINLKGRGDMLFLLPGETKPLHLQGINVLDSTIQTVIDHCTKFKS